MSDKPTRPSTPFPFTETEKKFRAREKRDQEYNKILPELREQQAIKEALLDSKEAAERTRSALSKGSASDETSPKARPSSPGGGRFRAETGFRRE